MKPRTATQISRYLAKVLRHTPEEFGLEFQSGGWVNVDDLLQACAKNDIPLSLTMLQDIVRDNNKQRFAFSDDGLRIRANQGHSAQVDLELMAAEPPPVLYHGSAVSVVPLILASGLKKMNRHHVHLTADYATAIQVGQRHGVAIVFCVDTVSMIQDGLEFYQSANGVWLTDHVPVAYLKLMSTGDSQ